MADLGLRLLERAAAGGGVVEVIRLVRQLWRLGREDEALAVLRGAFNEKSYSLIRQFLLDEGFFVFFHSWKGREVFSIFDVSYFQ